MGNLTLPKGTIIYQEDAPLTHIACIIKGSVSAKSSSESMTLRAGDVLGIVDVCRKAYSFTYQADDDCMIVTYPLKREDQFEKLCRENAALAKYSFGSCIRQVSTLLESYFNKKYEGLNLYSFLQNSYEKYKKLCGEMMMPTKPIPVLSMDEDHTEGELPVYYESDEPEVWLETYYGELSDMLKDHVTEPLMKYPAFLSGLILKTAFDASLIISGMHRAQEYLEELSSLLINDKQLDFFDLFTSLDCHCLKIGKENLALGATISTLENQLRSSDIIPQDLVEERIASYKSKVASIIEDKKKGIAGGDADNHYRDILVNSIDTILKYSNCPPETAISFKQLVSEYKQVVDKNSSDAAFKELRLKLTALFYDVYLSAFKRSLSDTNIPIILKMFFQFGYVDEELAGWENAAFLYTIAEAMAGDPKKNIYTAYEWLAAVYNGQKQPRRNEYDVDYQGYVHELRINQKITRQEEREYLEDGERKLLFEIENFFPLVNKLCYGRITTFCPVFSEHNVMADLKNALVTVEKLVRGIEDIRVVDFSAFYREEMFFDSVTNVRELVQMEVLPDIILMPNVGSRGIMWQEVEGKRRSSPATYALPVFLLEDLYPLLIRMTGEFRFEMCKRVQGPRWNDVSEPSLTSEYCDYAQFYRKNNELTPDAKDKVRAALAKARNNYKQMFVQDYLIWITYECKGSPRLNKVARKILFTYCPFSKEIRESLSVHPIYKEVMERWSILHSQAKNRFDNLLKKLQASGKEIPDALLKQREFMEM